jgi:hypothetical protein
LYKGKKVGYMDNYSGFSVYSKSLLKQLQKVEGKYKLGIWNPTSDLTMEQFGKEYKLREAIRKIIDEDFAGSYPEHVRKKFDGKRRKQSEVLGYKLTGVNDVKTEIDDATVKEHVAGGLTYKKGKTVMVTHKTSGKELVIIDNPKVKKEYEKIGYFAEGKITESGIMYKAGVKKYGKEGMKKIQSAAGKDKGHEEIGKIKDKYEKGKKEGVVREGSETPVEVARRIVQNGQHEKYKGMMLDTFTASAIVKVYDAVNDSNKKKLDSLKLPKLVNIVWKLLKKVS